MDCERGNGADAVANVDADADTTLIDSMQTVDAPFHHTSDQAASCVSCRGLVFRCNQCGAPFCECGHGLT